MKSHESDLVELVCCIYIDATAKCTAIQHDLRDLNKIRSRVKHEGISFLTITLPAFGKDFERCLDLGLIDSTVFQGFRKTGAIPAFLQGMLSLVFDRCTGGLLDVPSIPAIEGVRQICLTFKKMEVACTAFRSAEAINEYARSEHDLECQIPETDRDDFIAISKCVWSHAFDTFDVLACIPKHGPGATAERISGNQKYTFKRWHNRLEPYFPLFHNAYSSESAYGSAEFQDLSVVDEDNESPVRVITVPKTLKSPRIIAIEPVCMQYAQQSISRELLCSLERFWLTSGHINFKNQQVNRDLAISASYDRSYATLDLSAASDRVPRSLALDMFDGNPDLRDAIDACRSRSALLPNGDLLSPLRKFASMGSALCFPVESMYFYTLCIGALLRKRHLLATPRNAFKVSRDVFVYGDDIIVPTNDAVDVVDHLQKYYCKVNVSKSFYKGNFRESCGADAYAGELVTPVYIRQLRPYNMHHATAIVSYVSASNSFYKKGYWRTAAMLKNIVESVTGELPVVGEQCSGLGWVSFQRTITPDCKFRWNRNFQVHEVWTWCAVPVYQNDRLDGYPALLKCLLSQISSLKYGDPATEDTHLSKVARHGAFALKRRWVRPY